MATALKKKELFPFQREDVDRFINEGHKSGFFAYEQSLGKTLTAVQLTLELGTSVNLVVGPQLTYRSWAKAVAEQSEGEHELRWLKNGTKKGLAVFEDFFNGVPGWYFITWGLMREGYLHGERADMVIGDEIHEIQNHNGSNQNILLKKIESEYKLGLSGTGAGNKQEGLFGPLNWMWPKLFKSYWGWLKENFFLAGQGASLTPIREKRPGLVTSKIPFFVRRLKADHFKDIVPEPLPVKEVLVDLSPKQRELYDRFEETSGTWLDENDKSAGFLYTDTSLVKTARLREIALGTPVMELTEKDEYRPTFPLDTKSTKIEKLIEIIRSRPGETFVVYTHSKRFLPAAVHQLNKAGIKAAAFSGDLNVAQKEKVIDALGETIQVLVATITSIGTGTDGLQFRSSKIVWLSRDVKVSMNSQARERLARPGQTERVEQWEIVARDTRDQDTNDHLDLTEQITNDMLNANKLITT